jgi:hypothetical protein
MTTKSTNDPGQAGVIRQGMPSSPNPSKGIQERVATTLAGDARTIGRDLAALNEPGHITQSYREFAIMLLLKKESIFALDWVIGASSK